MTESIPCDEFYWRICSPCFHFAPEHQRRWADFSNPVFLEVPSDYKTRCSYCLEFFSSGDPMILLPCVPTAGERVISGFSLSCIPETAVHYCGNKISIET